MPYLVVRCVASLFVGFSSSSSSSFSSYCHVGDADRTGDDDEDNDAEDDIRCVVCVCVCVCVCFDPSPRFLLLYVVVAKLTVANASYMVRLMNGSLSLTHQALRFL